MLVLAPAACILSGIALSEVFSVLTRSIKFQLSKFFDDSPTSVWFLTFFFFVLESKYPSNHLLTTCFLLKLKSGDSSPESSTNSTKNENRIALSETAPKEKPSKKNRKKEKEAAESVPVKPKKEKRLLVLPFELSVMGILLLIVLGGFYVVSSLLLVLPE
jgi:dolichyl-diphosphooligosaccharide--protein glycosyltransferase